MKKENKRIEKLCSFYVSNWHFTTMLLPYINSKINENAKIITILENNIEENVRTLVEKLNLQNKEKILAINWKEIKSEKYEDIEARLKKETKQDAENIILINGYSKYIEKNNENIEKWVTNSNVKSVKIINFFEITEFNHNMVKILDSHDKVFNTSGEKEIADVFEGYTRKEELA